MSPTSDYPPTAAATPLPSHPDTAVAAPDPDEAGGIRSPSRPRGDSYCVGARLGRLILAPFAPPRPMRPGVRIRQLTCQFSRA